MFVPRPTGFLAEDFSRVVGCQRLSCLLELECQEERQALYEDLLRSVGFQMFSEALDIVVVCGNQFNHVAGLDMPIVTLQNQATN